MAASESRRAPISLIWSWGALGLASMELSLVLMDLGMGANGLGTRAKYVGVVTKDPSTGIKVMGLVSRDLGSIFVDPGLAS